MNGYVFLFISGYLFFVLKNDKSKELLNLVTNESDFIKWVIAFAIVKMIAGKLEKTGGLLITMVYVAMALTAVNKNPKVFDNLTSVLQIRG